MPMPVAPRQFQDLPVSGDEMHALAARLYPICRSITGDGVRQSLRELQHYADIVVHEVPTGSAILDWTVPPEWSLREAHITNSRGQRIVDLADHALHVVSYSTPVRAQLTLSQLRPHLHSLPEQPDLIPYRTSYFVANWGFCLPHQVLETLPEDRYTVVIDSALTAGSLTYGEYLHRGDTDSEVLLSAHICHPSLANDNCSGLAVLALLAQQLKAIRTRYSYRFLFAPGTIGAITWLARNREHVARIKHGLVVSNVGDGGGPTYKRSRQGSAAIDRAASHVLGRSSLPAQLVDFTPYGYDERQYCSPGFDLPVGSFQRSVWGQFPEYHTSADNLAFIRPEHLATSFRLICGILDVLEGNVMLRNTCPFGEPQLGRRGIYDAIDGRRPTETERMAMLWVLNLADGRNDLLAIADRAHLDFAAVRTAATRLSAAGLLEAVT